jgi:hypothetical protein
MDVEKFIIEFQDHLARRLDTYEQALYLYIFRHTRLIGKDQAVLGFLSARTRMACGVGREGTPMSPHTCYVKLESLQAKGCLEILDTERMGRRIRLKLPHEIPGVIPPDSLDPVQSLEEMDFFNTPENRKLILEREGHLCFYCLRKITPENHVIEHVVSRPEGDNGYRNVVAACRECNNRKGSLKAEDFLRMLYRTGTLNSAELESRMSQLKCLQNGEHCPVI